MNEQKVELMKRRKHLEDELKKVKEDIKESKSKNNGNASNTHMRVSNDFSHWVDNINNKRLEIGFEKLTNPKITELILRHDDFKSSDKIIEDIIHFNIEIEENRGIPNVII